MNNDYDTTKINETREIVSDELPPVRIHFSKPFPIETRTLTEQEEYAIVEILKVEYGIDECTCAPASKADTAWQPKDDTQARTSLYDVTFYVTGIKSFSVSDDNQACLIKWTLKPIDAGVLPTVSGEVSTGAIEMGERFDECEAVAAALPAGDYLFDILYT